jgi:hypothetical protein
MAVIAADNVFVSAVAVMTMAMAVRWGVVLEGRGQVKLRTRSGGYGLRQRSPCCRHYGCESGGCRCDAIATASNTAEGSARRCSHGWDMFDSPSNDDDEGNARSVIHASGVSPMQSPTDTRDGRRSSKAFRESAEDRP